MMGAHAFAAANGSVNVDQQLDRLAAGTTDVQLAAFAHAALGLQMKLASSDNRSRSDQFGILRRA